MISHAYAPPCGCAAALHLALDPTATGWRLLRRVDDDFIGIPDPDAVVVAEALRVIDPPLRSSTFTYDYHPVLDFTGLTNGVPAWYALYERYGSDWEASGDPVSVTPAYLAEPLYTAPDLAELLRDRLGGALRAEVAAQRLRHETGAIPVLTAHPRIDSVRLPVVTVILVDRRADVRAIGEIVTPDSYDGEYWSAFEGWMDRSTVQVTVWALNHEDRLRLRNAVQRALMLNLPILDAAGFTLPELSDADDQDFDRYDAPVYQSAFTLSCLHPAMVRTQFPDISSIEAYPNGEE